MDFTVTDEERFGLCCEKLQKLSMGGKGYVSGGLSLTLTLGFGLFRERPQKLSTGGKVIKETFQCMNIRIIWWWRLPRHWILACYGPVILLLKGVSTGSSE